MADSPVTEEDVTTETQDSPQQYNQALFRFLDLPAEIRNKVYRLCLIKRTVMEICDLTPDQYAAKKCGGYRSRRSTYTAEDHPSGPLPYTYTWSNPYWPLEETTYTWRRNHREYPPVDSGIDLFLVNRQLRQEAAYIFYGTNVFLFAYNERNRTLHDGSCTAYPPIHQERPAHPPYLREPLQP